jgi:phosphoglycerate dehydrogenase-like enzyme
MKKAAFLCDMPEMLERVFDDGRQEQVAAITDLYPTSLSSSSLEQHTTALHEIEVIFSTWGMPKLTPEQLRIFPALKAVFYAAGSVKSFARPLLEQNIVVSGAREANAVPVAEFTLAHILLGCKQYFQQTVAYTERRDSDESIDRKIKGCYGETIALLGCGAIARKVVELLQPFRLNVIVYDPFLTDEEAVALGLEKVSLQAAFERGYVVSNHAPDIEETAEMLNEELFGRMRNGATFINTGRGRTVVEEDLINVLKQRPDVTAVLDVSWPEPPQNDSELYTLPNVKLSPHIAGSLGDEVSRMADFAIAAFQAWEQGEVVPGIVALDMLDMLA